MSNPWAWSPGPTGWTEAPKVWDSDGRLICYLDGDGIRYVGFSTAWVFHEIRLRQRYPDKEQP